MRRTRRWPVSYPAQCGRGVHRERCRSGGLLCAVSGCPGWSAAGVRGEDRPTGRTGGSLIPPRLCRWASYDPSPCRHAGDGDDDVGTPDLGPVTTAGSSRSCGPSGARCRSGRPVRNWHLSRGCTAGQGRCVAHSGGRLGVAPWPSARPDRLGPRRVPRTEAPVVTEAVGPFEGVEAARQPRASRTVSCSFSCSQRDSTLGQGRHPGPSSASMSHTRESYGYICTL